MATVKELERPAGAVPGVPECSAMIPLALEPGAFPQLMRCPEPPVGRFEGHCPCGHVRDGWLCEGHAGMLAASGCRACLEDKRMPHGCPLTVTPAGNGAAR